MVQTAARAQRADQAPRKRQGGMLQLYAGLLPPRGARAASDTVRPKAARTARRDSIESERESQARHFRSRFDYSRGQL